MIVHYIKSATAFYTACSRLKTRAAKYTYNIDSVTCQDCLAILRIRGLVK